MLREENKEASIISTSWDKLSKEAIEHALSPDTQLEGIFEEEKCPVCGHYHHHHEHEEHHHEEGACGCDHEHHHHHHHHADEIFTSWGQETAHKYTEEELDFLLKALSETEGYGTILRAKGIVEMENGAWKQFDLVPQEYEVRESAADYTGRLCVIGTDLKEDELTKLFHL